MNLMMILRQLWNQRAANGWILGELVVVIPEGVDSFLTPGMLLNPVVIGITFLVSLILNVLSALIPALHALKKDIVYSLNDKR